MGIPASIYTVNTTSSDPVIAMFATYPKTSLLLALGVAALLITIAINEYREKKNRPRPQNPNDD